MAAAKCAFCGKALPEPGNTHVAVGRGRLEDYDVCIQCLKAQKLKLVALRPARERCSRCEGRDL